MRRLLYIVILAALALIPAQRTDIGKLLPVELVSVAYTEGLVEIKTDTGNIGKGVNIDSAYQDLKKSASSQIFLDTADYLILNGAGEELMEGLSRYLRSGVRVCRAEGEIDMEAAAQYLSMHRPKYRLKNIQGDAQMDILRQTENGFSMS